MAADSTKRMKVLRGLVDRQKLYPVTEALSLVKQTARAKFDESVDVAVQLGVDSKIRSGRPGFGRATGWNGQIGSGGGLHAGRQGR